MKADQQSGSSLVAKGDKTLSLTASTIVKNSGGRLARILVVSGTGTIDVYDGTSSAGTHLWSGTAAAGGIFELDVPCVTGIYIALGATTTVTAVYA